jgi:hypothetical protein
MARREKAGTEFLGTTIVGKGGRPSVPSFSGSQEFQLGELKNSIRSLDAYIQASLKNVTDYLARSGVTVARRNLREATTPQDWGKSRMAGEHYGVRFAPYGRSAGREETGHMYDSLTSSVKMASYGKTMWRGTFGWENPKAYIVYQELGFYSTGAFDPGATAASGRAKFTTGIEQYIPGARSLPKALPSIRRRIPAALSAVRNEAIRMWKADGFKGRPASYAKMKPPNLLITTFFD